MVNMARIHVIDDTEATGTLQAYYDEMQQQRGWIPNIRKALSLKPDHGLL